MILQRSPEARKPAQHRRSPWIALVLLVSLAVTLAGIFPFRQIIAQQRQVELTEAKLDALRGENRTLEQQIELLQSPAEVERLAREELGLVRRGETAYSVTMTSDQAPQAELGDVGATLSEGDGRSLWQKVWDFLTGRDLVPDG